MAEGAERSVSLSGLFDKTYEEFDKIINSHEVTSTPAVQERIREVIKKVEELTKGVSAVDMFSRNEHYSELDPQVLKFLLLPYMLGRLWQIDTGVGRRQACEVSEVYFKDFLKRCQDYEFTEGEAEITEAEEKAGQQPRKVKALTPEEKRNRKIRKVKENRELDDRILALQQSIGQDTDPDSTTVRDMYTRVIRRAINQVEDELESIGFEMELIKMRESREGEGNEQVQPPPQSTRPPSKPFIITKDDAQKKVFGMGYPSLPVMTVEELYASRRATGEWGPPPASGVGLPNPEDTGEEAEAIALETLSEQDDDANIERQRRNDEYKDDHRRGWGNRFNRS